VLYVDRSVHGLAHVSVTAPAHVLGTLVRLEGAAGGAGGAEQGNGSVAQNERVLCEGWVEKKGDIWGGGAFKKRWMVLSGIILDL
jgi:hypothetical protein